MTLHDIFKAKPYLIWYVKNTDNLSEDSMLEHILNYGDWDDYQQAEQILGLAKTHALFKKLTQRKRVNLRPEIVNYFTRYLQKYA